MMAAGARAGTGPAARTLAAVMLAMFTASLSLVLPTDLAGAVTAGLHASGPQVTWYHGLFVAAAAATGLPWAAIGDRAGRKPVLLAGFALVAAGSAVAFTAPGIQVLLAAQVIAGVGGGALYTASLAVLAAAFTAAARGRAIALWAVAFAFGTCCGQLLAGAAANGGGSWRDGYAPVLAVAVAAGGAAAWLAPVLPSPVTRRSYDWAGQVLAVLTVAGTAYGLIQGSSDGWSSAPVIAAFAVAAVALCAFVRIEPARPEPLLRLRLFRSPAFSAASAAALATGITFIATMYAESLKWGVAGRLDPWGVAIRGFWISVPIVILWPLFRYLLARASVRWVLSAGLLPLAAGQAWLALVPAGAPLWQAAVPVLVAGIGWGFAVCCITQAMVNAAPYSAGGQAAGATETLRVFGQAAGGAITSAGAFPIAGAALAGSLHAASRLLPARAAHAALAINGHGGAVAVASAGLGPRIALMAAAALGRGLDDALYGAAAVTAVTAVAVAVFLRDRPAVAPGGGPAAAVPAGQSRTA